MDSRRLDERNIDALGIEHETDARRKRRKKGLIELHAAPSGTTLQSRTLVRKGAADRLDLVFQGGQKPRAVFRRKAAVVGLPARRFTQMPLQIAHAKRHADAIFGKRFARRTEHARAA